MLVTAPGTYNAFATAKEGVYNCMSNKSVNITKKKAVIKMILGMVGATGSLIFAPGMGMGDTSYSNIGFTGLFLSSLYQAYSGIMDMKALMNSEANMQK